MTVVSSQIKFQIVSVPDVCHLYLFMNISILNLRLTYLKSSIVHKIHNCGYKSNYSTPLCSQEFAYQNVSGIKAERYML